MIGQTIAIFVDAYRDLNARKLFWITLILSAAVVVAFALVGADAHGISIAGAHFDTPNGRVFYNLAFQQIVIGLWLTWVATILALVSTAGIFPDFISGGSIDIYLAKPIGRARLFLTKYLSGLMFVTLQVLVVAAGSFIVMGLRAHQWKPQLFLAVPIVVCFFSYLYGICVLLGVQTRSTIAALMLTILCWGLFALLDRGEPALLVVRNMYETRAKQAQSDVEADQANLRHAQSMPQAGAMVPLLQQTLDTATKEAESAESTASRLRFFHRLAYGIKTVTPKTTDTIDYLTVLVFPNKAEVDPAEDPEGGGPFGPRGANRPPTEEVNSAKEAVKELKSRSAVWIIGTSLAFEAVLVGGAMWIFCRRDY